MNNLKMKWLDRNGYKPITDDVIYGWIEDSGIRVPEHVAERFKHAKENFSFYKRYGKTTVLYSEEYLSSIDLKTIKRNNWRMIRWHVIGVWQPFRFFYIARHRWWRIRMKMIK